MANTLKTALPNLTEDDFRQWRHNIVSFDIELKNGTTLHLPISRCKVPNTFDECAEILVHKEGKYRYAFRWDSNKVGYYDYETYYFMCNLTFIDIVSITPNFGKRNLSIEVKDGRYVISEDGTPIYDIPICKIHEFMIYKFLG